MRTRYNFKYNAEYLIPDVGSMLLASSPANTDSKVVLPAPPKPIQTTENSGRGVGRALQHKVLNNCKLKRQWY